MPLHTHSGCKWHRHSYSHFIDKEMKAPNWRASEHLEDWGLLLAPHFPLHPQETRKQDNLFRMQLLVWLHGLSFINWAQRLRMRALELGKHSFCSLLCHFLAGWTYANYITSLSLTFSPRKERLWTKWWNGTSKACTTALDIQGQLALRTVPSCGVYETE